MISSHTPPNIRNSAKKSEKREMIMKKIEQDLFLQGELQLAEIKDSDSEPEAEKEQQ